MVARGCGEHMSVLHMVAHGCRLRSCCQKPEAGQAVGPYTWLTDAVRGRMHKVAGLRAKKFYTRLQVSGPGGSVAYRVLGTRLQGLGPGLFCTVSL